MPYHPWPAQGCSLAETRDRVSGTHSHISSAGLARFIELFKVQALISYGRVSGTTAPASLIAPTVWHSVASLDWVGSRLPLLDKKTAYDDVRVFPLVFAPCRVDLLDNRPLIEIFQKSILEDPEVRRLGERAIACDEAYRRVYFHGCCFAHGANEWPLAYEHRQLTGANGLEESPVGYLANPDPPAVLEAAAALISRYGELMSLLRRGELDAGGLTEGGRFSPIPPSVWMHPKFYFDARTGDVSEVNAQTQDFPWDRLIKRWSAVMLYRPSINSRPTFHVEPSEHHTVRSSTLRLPLTGRTRPKTEAVQAAMKRAGIDIATTPLSANEIAAKIAKQQQLQHEYSADRFRALVKVVSRLRANRRAPDN